MCCKAMNARYALFLVLLVAVPSIAEIQLRGAAGAYTKGLSRMRCSQLSLALRGGMPEQLWWQRPYKSNAERWAEAGVSLQPDFGPDVNLDVPMEVKLGDAAEHGDVSAVTRLLQAGANVKATDWAGFTALHRAAFNGHVECCEVLIKGGAQVNAQDAVGGRTALHQAAARNHREVAEKLIEQGADARITDFPYKPDVDKINVAGLREAIEQCPPIAKGADETTKIHNYPGLTALEYAEFEGHKATADALRPWTKEY